ncbi:unnamed protein product [Durusdinium trenchii]|uniref:Methyltransferase type 11 domain-containing protein n=1 Tax=Durusdinium trenchii TaxID=1381693 RepID=A0ABP0L0T6_9DINO
MQNVDQARLEQWRRDPKAATSFLAGAKASVVMELLPQMVHSQIQVNAFHCSAALSACEKKSVWTSCLHILDFMKTWRVAPNEIHYSVAMKALRPESHWRQGLHLLSSVVTAPNAVHASLALGSCPSWPQALRVMQVMRELRLQSSSITFSVAISTCQASDAQQPGLAGPDVLQRCVLAHLLTLRSKGKAGKGAREKAGPGHERILKPKVGCGPGSITRGFASRVSSVVGVDSSAEVIATAKAKAAERDSEERTGSVTFEVASAYELPYEDETFDVVFAHQLLQHLSEPLRALQEMRRVCKAGGLVAAREVAYSTMQGAPVLPGLHRWREVYMMTAQRNGGEPDAGLYLKKWMNSAGFTSLRFTTSTVTHSDSGTDAAAAKRFFGESWATRTLETFGPQAVAFGFCSAGELDEMAAAWRSWAQEKLFRDRLLWKCLDDGTCAAWHAATCWLQRMQQTQLRVDPISFSAAIGACSKCQEWREVLNLLTALGTGGMRADRALRNAAAPGRWRWALSEVLTSRVVEEAPDEVTFRALLAGCFWSDALHLLQQMTRDRCSPNAICLSSCINACDPTVWPQAIGLLSGTLAVPNAAWFSMPVFKRGLDAGRIKEVPPTVVDLVGRRRDS